MLRTLIYSFVSTIAEIEAAVEKLPPTQQQELYASLGARLKTLTKRGLSPEEFDVWLKKARGVGMSGMTTDQIMAMTRGEE
jgi:hypothetical protein